MDYIGSKEKLNEWIFSILEQYIDEPNGWFLDACAGSGSTSRFASLLGWKVISNDLFKFSSIVVKGSCQFDWNANSIEAVRHMININELKPKMGFFYNNYTEAATPPRYFFTEENAGLIDAARLYIEENTKDNEQVYNYLLWMLLEKMSSVSNTTGVQAAFLKKFKDRALQKLRFGSIERNVHFNKNIKCFNENIVDLLTGKNKRVREKVIYIDPPYNNRQYGPNYHLYETLIRNDEPEIKGKGGLRNWKEECKSSFCNKEGFDNIMTQIIDNTYAEYLILSYSTDGLKTVEEIQSLFSSHKKVEKIDVEYLEQKRYKADSDQSSRNYNKNDLFELLFIATLKN